MTKKKKVTLIWTLYKPLINQKILPSLSIAYLAKFLEQKGFKVDCIDCNVLVYDKWKYQEIDKENKNKILLDLVKEAENTKPQIIGIGFWTEGISFVREFVALIKKRNPHIKIVIGGSTASFLPEKIIDFLPEIDYVVRGEGEVTLWELISKISAGLNTTRVLGTSYRNSAGIIINNPPRPLISNLDRLPLLDFENFVYTGRHDGLHIVASRGCPYNCCYCSSSNFYERYRSYSPEYIKRQILRLLKLYNIKYIALDDDNVMVNPVRAVKIFGLLAAANLDCEFPASARIDNLSKELLSVLAKAKVPWLTVGVENIIPKVLSFYRRTNNPAKYLYSIKRGISLIEKFKIGAAYTFITGSPIETENDMFKNLNFMKKLAKKKYLIYASFLRVVPGSFFWRQFTEGKMEVISLKNRSTGFPYDDKFLDIQWVCPINFAFKHSFYSDKKYFQIRSEILSEISKLNS